MGVKLAIPFTDRPIPWTSHAKFLEIGREGHFSGNLRDCIAHYRELSPGRRGMAMIISDVLVPIGRGLPAVRKLEPRDMDALLEAFHAEDRGRSGSGDDEALAVTEPASLPV